MCVEWYRTDRPERVRDPHARQDGDCISIKEDGEHPGFALVPGMRWDGPPRVGWARVNYPGVPAARRAHMLRQMVDTMDVDVDGQPKVLAMRERKLDRARMSTDERATYDTDRSLEVTETRGEEIQRPKISADLEVEEPPTRG